jgi:hypothetical protein
MKTLLPDEPPNPSNIPAALGLPMPAPAALVQALRALYDLGQRGGEGAEQLFAEVTGIYLAGASVRYPQTPPELFPFATLGVNGVHYGYVIHAPELRPDDYPVGELDPMSDEGVILVGKGTFDALENLLSWQLGWDEGPATAETIAKVSEAIGIQPEVAKANRRYGISGMGLPVVPEIPTGWRYVSTADGVGVLAPEAAFWPGATHLVEPDAPVDHAVSQADEALAAGYPATALYFLREAFWRHWTNEDLARRISIQQAEAYSILDRHALAEIVRQCLS